VSGLRQSGDRKRGEAVRESAALEDARRWALELAPGRRVRVVVGRRIYTLRVVTHNADSRRAAVRFP